MILEEFGVTINQSVTYTAWLNEVLSSGLTGDLIWQVLYFIYSNNKPLELTMSIIQASWFSSLKACRHFFLLSWLKFLTLTVCSGDTPNDGYAIYPDSPIYSILTSHASDLKSGR